jgi:nucleotide-binding universal stress UspA family protein
LQTTTPNVGDTLSKTRKIALALDGSESSLRACEAAAIVAQGFRANVDAVCVLPHFFFPQGNRTPDDSAHASLEKAVAMLTSFEGVTTASKIIEAKSSSISEALINYVEEEKSDLLVCGHRGGGGFDRLLLGSVSSGLVSHCPAPVLVVRDNPQRKIGFNRILVGTDGSDNAWRGIALATSLARALASKLTFANVVFNPPLSYTVGAGDWLDEALKQERAAAQNIVSKAQFFAKDREIESNTTVIDDMHSPVEALTKLAQKGDYNLIVVGTRGFGGFKKLALGSTASGIAHYAHCSVLVVR